MPACSLLFTLLSVQLCVPFFMTFSSVIAEHCARRNDEINKKMNCQNLFNSFQKTCVGKQYDDSEIKMRYRIFLSEHNRQVRTQNRQSAKLFLQSSELGFPYPLTRRRVCTPSSLVPGGHTRLRERRWGGGGPNSDEGTDTVVL